jgi:hypothetical protein
MTPQELRAALQRLALTTGQAAARVGAQTSDMERWLEGDAPVPAPVATLVETWAQNAHIRASLRAKGDTQP